MKKNIYIPALILLTVGNIVAGAFIAHATQSDKSPVVITTQPEDPLTREQRAWLYALIWCESRGNEHAINKVDRDGTPSYGLLQFKPSTFSRYNEKYGLPATDDYMNPEAQIAIVEQMIIRNDVRWSNEFPMCTKKLGNPPRLSTQKN